MQESGQSRCEVDPEAFKQLMNEQQRFFEAWTNAVVRMGQNLPSVDPETREAWCRQAEFAKAALHAYGEMMTQITEQISASVFGSDHVAMEAALNAVAPKMRAFMKTWGPQLHAMQQLTARWAAQNRN